MIKKVKNTVSWTYVINDLNDKKTVWTFHEKELQKKNQKEFRIDKVIKKNGENLYVKWKGYNNSFNNCIDKKHIINEWIFSKTEIFRSKCKSWIRFV